MFNTKIFAQLKITENPIRLDFVYSDGFSIEYLTPA